MMDTSTEEITAIGVAQVCKPRALFSCTLGYTCVLEHLGERHANGVRELAAADWDRAAVLNDAGFSKLDSGIGHRLADLDSLTPKQAALATLLCQRYRRQLGELGERASQVVHEATPPAP